MRISYRISSIAVLLVFVGMFLLPESLMVRPRAPTKALVEGAVSFDPCTMWEQSGWLIRLSSGLQHSCPCLYKDFGIEPSHEWWLSLALSHFASVRSISFGGFNIVKRIWESLSFQFGSRWWV